MVLARQHWKLGDQVIKTRGNNDGKHTLKDSKKSNLCRDGIVILQLYDNI